MRLGDNGRAGGAGIEPMGAAEPASGLGWLRILVWFVRALSIAWLLKGLSGWAVILGVMDTGLSFVDNSLAAQTATVFFALVDVIAGVGLWMVSRWGGVVWLISMACHVMLGLAVPRAIALSGALIGVYLLLAIAFVLLAWAAIRQEMADQA